LRNDKKIIFACPPYLYLKIFIIHNLCLSLVNHFSFSSSFVLIMLIFSLLLIPPIFGLLCSQVDIGTDLNVMGNVVRSGVVQPGWSYHDAAYKSSPPQGEIYFYMKGLDKLGPTFEVSEFHHEDEIMEDFRRWVFMNVSIDEKVKGLVKDYTAFKVVQECVDREGGTSLHMSITFTARTCDPITITWIKVCGEPTATQTGLSIGLSPATAEVVTGGVVTASFDGNTEYFRYVVDAKTASTTLYMYNDDPSVKVFYKEPYTITDHEVLYPTLTGTMATSGYTDVDPLELVVTYNCLVDDGKKEEIILVVELPYFHDLEIHFFKECGEKQGSLGISTVVLFLGVVCIALCIWQRVSSCDVTAICEGVKEWVNSVGKKTEGVLRRRNDTQMEEIQDDDGKFGFNVHTSYGTT
jgi:hypothetical protein